VASQEQRKAEDGKVRPDGRRGVATELLLAGAELSQLHERMLRSRSGLSLHQFNVLRTLESRQPDATHATDLTRTLGMSSAHATAVLQQLEGRGLVERSVSGADRRRRVVVTTAAGRSALASAWPALERVERGVEEALPRGAGPDDFQTELRTVRLALRQGLALQDWEDCVGP